MNTRFGSELPLKDSSAHFKRSLVIQQGLKVELLVFQGPVKVVWTSGKDVY